MDVAVGAIDTILLELVVSSLTTKKESSSIDSFPVNRKDCVDFCVAVWLMRIPALLKSR